MTQTTKTRSRILVVDDSLIVRQVLKNLLEKHGFDVALASSGEEALIAVDEGVIHGMILDIHMEGLSGYDVLERLPDISTHVPVIVLSADWQEASRRKVTELGARYFLNKPPKETELLEALADVLG